MSTRFLLKLLMMLLLLVSCQSPGPDQVQSEPSIEPTEVPPSATPVPPTATAVPPTATAVIIEETAAQWQEVRRLSGEGLPGFLAFENPEFGISSCDDSSPPPIHHITTNGGQSWESTDCNVATGALDIVDQQSIWTCGRTQIRTSNNGGESWEQVGSVFIGGCTLLTLVDNEVGWAAASSKLVATNDGGSSWEEIALPEGIQKLIALSLLSQESGYLLDDGLTLYSTDDGGESWQAQPLLIEDDDLAFAPMGISSAAMRFVDSDNGIVVTNLAGGGNSKLLALHTSDGGQTWTQHDVATGLGSVYLSKDGAYLTVTLPGRTDDIVILENQ